MPTLPGCHLRQLLATPRVVTALQQLVPLRVGEIVLFVEIELAHALYARQLLQRGGHVRVQQRGLVVEGIGQPQLVGRQEAIITALRRQRLQHRRRCLGVARALQRYALPVTPHIRVAALLGQQGQEPGERGPILLRQGPAQANLRQLVILQPRQGLLQPDPVVIALGEQAVQGDGVLHLLHLLGNELQFVAVLLPVLQRPYRIVPGQQHQAVAGNIRRVGTARGQLQLPQLLRLAVSRGQLVGPAGQLRAALPGGILHQAGLARRKGFQLPRPHHLVLEPARLAPGGKEGIAGRGTGLAVIPQRLRAGPGHIAVAVGEPGPEIVALEVDAVGFVRHDLQKVIPAPVLARLPEVGHEEAVGQRRIGAAVEETAGFRRAHPGGLADQLGVIEIDSQRVVFQARPQLLVLGPVAPVYRLDRLAVLLAIAGQVRVGGSRPRPPRAKE